MNDHVVTDKVFLFTDLHNFSIVMTKLEEKAAGLLQEYYLFAGNIIIGAGGVIIKYLGDAVFGIFDIGREVDAVRAGIEMRERFVEVTKEFGVDEMTEMEVGISCGSCVHGTFGHPSLLVTDVFGDAVNEAAVIMHHRGVAITKPVFEAVREKIHCEKLEDLNTKWRETPLERWSAIRSI
jgi:adenylate cyclase